jgi:hypothetical protein
VVLIALLVCLIPTTIGALLSAIGIAGMDRLVQRNVLAMSGRAVEAAGDVQTLLLDKTGTITLGNRIASAFHPVADAPERDVASAAQLASLSDETPEGRSIVVLAKERFGIRQRELTEGHVFVPFFAHTRMSGLDVDGRQIRKGAVNAVRRWVTEQGGTPPAELDQIADRIARSGATPLGVADGPRLLGVIELKDVVKHGIRERFAELRAAGIRTVMITGDNPLTAADGDRAGLLLHQASGALAIRDGLSIATTALVLVIPVVIGVVIGGFVAGVISVAAGFIVYDFFFIPPYLTLWVGRPQNWAALGVYVVVMLPVARVVAGLNAARAKERRQGAELRELFQLSGLLLDDKPLNELLTVVVTAVAEVFGVRQVALLLPRDGTLEITAAAGRAAQPRPDQPGAARASRSCRPG